MDANMFTFLTALDTNFIIPTSVMLFSLDESLGTEYDCHIIVSKSDYAHVRQELDAIGLKKLKIKYLTIDLEKSSIANKNLSMRNIMHFSDAALFRLFSSSLIDASYKRIAYLDGDLLVRKDLHELTELKTGFAAVIDSDGHLVDSRVDKYFNSGVFIADLDFWRECNAESRMLDFLYDNPDSVYKDQDALNFVFSNQNIKPLDAKFNYIPKNRTKFENASCDPHIVHFAGHLKPWLRSTPNSRFVEEWRLVSKLLSLDFAKEKKWHDIVFRGIYLIGLDKVFIQIRNFLFSLIGK
jgi:lipopolysaccharide biosynthesis glycosyltransferase